MDATAGLSGELAVNPIKRLLRYIATRGWEDELRPVHYPLNLSKGDSVVINGRAYVAPRNMVLVDQGALLAWCAWRANQD